MGEHVFSNIVVGPYLVSIISIGAVSLTTRWISEQRCSEDSNVLIGYVISAVVEEDEIPQRRTWNFPSYLYVMAKLLDRCSGHLLG